MRQTPTTILASLAVLLVVAAATTGALLAGAGPALAQEETTGITTATTDVADDTDPGATTETNDDAEDTTDRTASITFEDQDSATGERVLVASATVPEGGFVVIAERPLSGDDSYDTIRGVSYVLGPGTTSNVPVQIDPGINQSGTTQLVATIHRDTNGNGEFDYNSSQGQADGPYTDAQGQILQLADVTIQQGDGQASASMDTTTDAVDAGVDTDAEPAEASTETTTIAETTATTETTTTTTETTTEATTTEATTEQSTTASDDGGGGSNLPGPGFGAGIAVIALLAAALLATRRA